MKNPNEPFYMKNPEWYYYDDKNHCFKLTDKAPKKALKSYIDDYINYVHHGEDVLLDGGYITKTEWENIVKKKYFSSASE